MFGYVTADGLWACPRCRTIVATDDATYPPGSEKSDVDALGCAACKYRKVPPDEWIRVDV